MYQNLRNAVSSNDRRRGLSLVEMLVAMTIMVIMAGALAALATSVETGNQYSQGHATATQHARVAIERIERNLREATASEQFPGFFVHGEVVGTWIFPDTLVIWHPAGSAANPSGLPLVRELVVYAADPDEPFRLIEMTLPGNSSKVPDLDDSAAWQTTLDSIKNSGSATHVQLTDLLRVAEDQASSTQRAVIRFTVTVSPSESEWDDYKLGDIDWSDVNWSQGIYGTQTGLRQVACHFELQMMPGLDSRQDDPGGQTALPFIGAAALYYQLEKP